MRDETIADVNGICRDEARRSSRCFFFFSSRRRHTRCSRDWSSDVCSSDLYEKATIPSTGAIQKSAVLKPPELVEPLNLAPIIAENPKTATVHFEWKPVQEAVSYRLRVSTTAMFTRTVVDK